MSVVYLVRQGTTLHRKDSSLLLCQGRRPVEKLPAEELDRLVVLGSVTLSPAAISFLLGRGIDTVFLSFHGRYLGRLSAGTRKNVYLRLQQYDRLRDAPFRLEVARRIVRAKILSQAGVLESRLKDGPNPVLSQGRERLLEAAAGACRAGDPASLRGFEGRAGAVYFRCFEELLRTPDFVFRGRNRRPPRDPVNVMLSLGYTLLLAALEREVEQSGLDPGVGCFHDLEYGRPSLVLDLQEEFRVPAVDLVVLRACNRRVMRLQDFYFPERMAEEARDLADFPELKCEAPVVLTYEGYRKFIGLFESRCGERLSVRPLAGETAAPAGGKRHELRALFRRQVARYVRAVKGEEEYEPVVWDSRR